MKGSEAGKVIGREKLNFFSCFLLLNVLNSQWMNSEGLADSANLLLCRVDHIQPPDAIFLIVRHCKEPLNVLSRHDKVSKFGSMDGRLPSRREEAESGWFRVRLH